MSTASQSSLQPAPSALKAILWGGFAAGALDLAYAMITGAFRGFRIWAVPHAIASGLLGVKSFDGGVPTAILGVALQFLIATVAAAVFYAASRTLSVLTRHALLAGVLYGAAIYAFMHVVVVPLSAAPHFHDPKVWQVLEFIDHLVFVGPPIALATRRFGM